MKLAPSTVPKPSVASIASGRLKSCVVHRSRTVILSSQLEWFLACRPLVSSGMQRSVSQLNSKPSREPKKNSLDELPSTRQTVTPALETSVCSFPTPASNPMSPVNTTQLRLSK